MLSSPSRHPGLDPGSRCLAPPEKSGTPDQVRGDGEVNVRSRPIAEIGVRLHYLQMADNVRSYFDMAPEEVYAKFLNGLAGLEDDASTEGFSREGLGHLHATLMALRAEFKLRHGSDAS